MWYIFPKSKILNLEWYHDDLGGKRDGTEEAPKGQRFSVYREDLIVPDLGKLKALWDF